MKNRQRSQKEYFVGRLGGTVFVGPLMPFALPSRGEVLMVSPLFTLPGMVEDLHQFADSLGLRRAWFQYHHTLPHYDLAENLRARAIGRGAKEVYKAELCDTLRTWREASRECRDRSISEQLGEPADPVRKDRLPPREEQPTTDEEAAEFHDDIGALRQKILGGKK